jgi:hypothetical protein
LTAGKLCVTLMQNAAPAAKPQTVMRHAILSSIVLTFVGCVSLQKSTNYQSILFDNSVLEQCSRSVPKADGYWNPTNVMARQLEIDLPQLNGSSAPKRSRPAATQGSRSTEYELDVSDYSYQYSGIVVEEKQLIYVNAFYNGHKVARPNWQYVAISVCAGGTGFWGVLYDPKEHSFSELAFNNVARER